MSAPFHLYLCGRIAAKWLISMKKLCRADLLELLLKQSCEIHRLTALVCELQPQVEEMITGDWDLTLFTCSTDGSTRCDIRCGPVGDWGRVSTAIAARKKE